MPFNLRKELIGTFLFFAEATASSGVQIDGFDVDINMFPDVTPPENFSSLGCVHDFTSEMEKENDNDWCPNAQGGYTNIDDMRVVQDKLKFNVRDHNEIFWRQLFGLRAPAQSGVAQLPYAETRRWVEGWLKVQARGQDGADRIVMNVWGRLDIDENPVWSKDVTKPSLMFQVIPSPIAVITPQIAL